MIWIVTGALAVILSMFCGLPLFWPSKPMVSIPGQGVVIGSLTESTWTHQKIQQFLGIPYAESPSGNLRFKVSFFVTYCVGGAFRKIVY